MLTEVKHQVEGRLVAAVLPKKKRTWPDESESKYGGKEYEEQKGAEGRRN